MEFSVHTKFIKVPILTLDHCKSVQSTLMNVLNVNSDLFLNSLIEIVSGREILCSRLFS